MKIRKHTVTVISLIGFFIFFSSCKSAPGLSFSQDVDARYLSKNIFPASPDNSITFVVIPDSQSYVDFRLQRNFFVHYLFNQQDIFYRQMCFIANNSVQNGGNIDFALHVGDLVDHRGYNINEWERAKQGFSYINNQLPFLTAIGNHDYDSWDYRKQCYGVNFYNKYFGSESEFYKNKDWYVGHDEDACSAALFKVKNHKFLILSLQLEPDDDDLVWAQTIIDDNKGVPTILLTHSYLAVEKEPESEQCMYTANTWRNKYSSNSANKVWKNFVSENDQIFLILCGHTFDKNLGEGNRIEINSFGNTTYAILSNYQARNAYLDFYDLKGKPAGGCGDGWLRFINISFDDDLIYIKTYSTEFNCFESDSDSEFVLPINWDWKNRFYGDF